MTRVTVTAHADNPAIQLKAVSILVTSVLNAFIGIMNLANRWL